MVETGTINPAQAPETKYELWSVPAYPTGTPEYVRGAEVGSNKQRVEPGDVLLCKINPRINRVWIVGERGPFEQIASTEWIVLRCPRLAPKFIMYQLREEDFRRRLCAEVSGVGGSLTRARPKIVSELALRLAPLKEQERIIRKIEELQVRSRRAAEVLEAIPEMLDQLRQSVLAAAFRGDLTKEWRAKHPDVEPASELLKRIRIERRKRWEEAELEKLKAKGLTGEKLNSEFTKRHKQYKEPIPIDTTDLPELPEGWTWTSWHEIGCCQNGRAFPSKYYSTEGVKLLRPGNLHVSGRIEWTSENTRRMPENWAVRFKDYIIGPQELVVNLTAQSLADEFLGRACMTDSEERCLLNQRIARLTPVLVSKSFCLWLFKSPVFRRYVDTLNTGSLIQHIFTTQIEKFIFPLPPLEEQQTIAKKLAELLVRKEKLADSGVMLKRQLQHLDDSTLSKAFHGYLVPQDPKDEPASILLERVRTDKAKVSKKLTQKG
jgi:type I restriction enzyme S subunit